MFADRPFGRVISHCIVELDANSSVMPNFTYQARIDIHEYLLHCAGELETTGGGYDTSFQTTQRDYHEWA